MGERLLANEAVEAGVISLHYGTLRLNSVFPNGFGLAFEEVGEGLLNFVGIAGAGKPPFEEYLDCEGS